MPEKYHLQVLPLPLWWQKIGPKIISAAWRRILMFKVTKWHYQSAQHDRIIYKWCHCLPCGKNWTKKLSQPFENGFWCSRCLNNHIKVLDMIESFANSATTSLAAKNGTKDLSQPFQDRFWFSRCLNNHIYEYSPKWIFCREMGFIGVSMKPIITVIFLI